MNIDSYTDRDTVVSYMLMPENITTFKYDILEYLIDDYHKNNKQFLEKFFEDGYTIKRIEEEIEENNNRQVLMLKAMREWDKKSLKKVAQELDGHSIFLTDKLLEDGLPEDVANYYSKRHWSDKNSYTSTLFDNTGKCVDFIEGINGLHLLHAICSTLDIKYEDAHGRGTRAFRMIKAIKEYCS